MKNLHLTLVPLGIVLMVAGCGGGGSPSSGNSGIPTAAVKITGSNAPTVAAGANNSTSTLTSTARSTSAPASATGVIFKSSASSLNVMNSALAGFASVSSLPLPPATVVGAVSSAPLSICSSGSGTASWNDADNSNNLSVGDTLSVIYTNCVDSTDGNTKKGGASFTFNADGFSLTYTGYSETSSSETLAMTGDMTIALSTVNALTTISMTGTSIETSSSINGSFKMWAPTGGNGYSTVITIDTITSEYTYDVDMSVASSEMKGAVSIVTQPAFAGVQPNNPSVGTMTITGAENSHMTLSAFDATQYVVSGTDGTTPFGPNYYAW